MPKIPKLARDPSQLHPLEAKRAIEERRERASELLKHDDDELSAADVDELKQLNDEIQALEYHSAPDPNRRHPGHQGAGRRRETTGNGLGRTFLDELARQNDGKLRAALDGTSGGSAVPTFFDPALYDLPQRALFVRSLIPAGPAAGDTVSFLQQTVATNNAAAVARGAIKPTSVYTVARQETPVQTIAHVSEALDRLLLSDYDQLTTFIEQQLRLGVLLATDNELINGSGTSPHLAGILNTSGIQTQAKGADPVPDAIQKAMTKIRLNAFSEPDAVVMHPNDWQDVSLLRTADGLYIWGAPVDEAQPQIWGKIARPRSPRPLPARETASAAARRSSSREGPAGSGSTAQPARRRTSGSSATASGSTPVAVPSRCS
jgi:HK97 family phage major capsid protein